MRLFLALNLEHDVRRAARDAAAPLRDAAPGVRWIPEDNLHLTLKFFGEQPDERASDIVSAVEGIAARHRPIELALDGAGAFPNFQRPRVVWLGVSNAPKLELLQHDVEIACESIGFPLEGRPFRPHLTLARAKPGDIEPAHRKALSRAARDIELVAETEIFTVDLMRSVTAAGGARYEIVRSLPLHDR